MNVEDRPRCEVVLGLEAAEAEGLCSRPASCRLLLGDQVVMDLCDEHGQQAASDGISPGRGYWLEGLD